MTKQSILIGMICLMLLPLVGCGVAQEQYDTVVTDLTQA